MRRIVAVILFAAAGFAITAVAGQGRAKIVVNGIARLAPFDPKRACASTRFRLTDAIGPLPSGTTASLRQCGHLLLVGGAFHGTPGAQAASYGWSRYRGKGGSAEAGMLLLETNGGGELELLTSGVQHAGSAKTSGTWTATGGTTGSGTYTFVLGHMGSGLETGRIRIEGALGG
jgi:hypothetical protein